MEIQITKTAVKDIKKFDTPTRERVLNETDVATIYNVLLRFIPTANPAADEINATEQAKEDIKNGDVFDLKSVNW